MMDNNDGDVDIAYVTSNNGWMKSDMFFNYIKKTFNSTVFAKRPVLLIFDGHTTHVDDQVIAVAHENNITIINLLFMFCQN